MSTQRTYQFSLTPPKHPISAKQFCLDHNLEKHAQGQLAGVDEVGRGPLIGDVVAAAVILPSGHGIQGLKDSKKIPEKKRAFLAEQIKGCAQFAIGRASPEEIDRLNILHASLLAMTRAVSALSPQADFVLIDGNRIPELTHSCCTLTKGDSWIEEISAASIIAKVERDQDMVRLDVQHPEYGFAQHKGYPTAHHRDMISQHGVLEQHRRSFSPVQRFLDEQMT